jgi:hypothetical protein
MFEELQSVARRLGDPTTRALLRRDPGRIPTLDPSTIGNFAAVGGSTPTLQEFADEFPEGFYSEAELTDLWNERFGREREAPVVRAHRRRARLIERQLAALHRLEHLAAADPVPADPTTAWLAPELCARLAHVGIQTLGEIPLFAALHGQRWFRLVPRVGALTAARLLDWLRTHEDSLGPLPRQAVVPRRLLKTDSSAPPSPVLRIAPLDRFKIPESARAVPTAISAIGIADDREAVLAWLALRKPETHTWRAYRKEAERFLLWTSIELGRPLSELTLADREAYRSFLRAPPLDWTASRSTPRWSALWRPFEGPLSPRSSAYSDAVVTSMLAWLVKSHYLASHPWGVSSCK